jgi:NAD(P)-dependent dehydrogenase (short-subunit alcohol dehydrogenase family)
MSWNVGAGLEDKGVVVTGATGGIGRQVAADFASAGARVCAIDLEQDALDEVVASFEAPSRHLALAADLTHLEGHDPLLRQTLDQFGRLDVLACVAAVLRRRSEVDHVTVEDWDLQINVNLKTNFFLNRAAAQLMKEQGRGGRIINFSSQGWWTGGFGGSVVYNASKGGIVSMTRGLARTYGPDNITVNAIAPGLVDTAMLRSDMTDEALDALTKQVPLGRMASPEEIAGTVVFLASDHASYISGATINVSGAWLMY